jgi:hypothetical protein
VISLLNCIDLSLWNEKNQEEPKPTMERPKLVTGYLSKDGIFHAAEIDAIRHDTRRAVRDTIFPDTDWQDQSTIQRSFYKAVEKRLDKLMDLFHIVEKTSASV